MMEDAPKSVNYCCLHCRPWGSQCGIHDFTLKSSPNKHKNKWHLKHYAKRTYDTYNKLTYCYIWEQSRLHIKCNLVMKRLAAGNKFQSYGFYKEFRVDSSKQCRGLRAPQPGGPVPVFPWALLLFSGLFICHVRVKLRKTVLWG